MNRIDSTIADQGNAVSLIESSTPDLSVLRGVIAGEGIQLQLVHVESPRGMENAIKISTYGIIGPQGSQGPQGPRGHMGPQGIPGSAGPEGIQGPMGPQGIQGVAGAQGVQGVAGINGSRWFSAAGEPVFNTDLGNFYLQTDTGSVWTMEESGWIHVTSLLGPQGNQGEKGEVGEMGPVNPVDATSKFTIWFRNGIVESVGDLPEGWSWTMTQSNILTIKHGQSAVPIDIAYYSSQLDGTYVLRVPGGSSPMTVVNMEKVVQFDLKGISAQSMGTSSNGHVWVFVRLGAF